MFTGIIHETGKVGKVEGKSLFIESGFADAAVGESISVNGACLTVSGIRPVTPRRGGVTGGSFPRKRESILMFDLSAETMKKSGLGRLRTGDAVNLERSMKMDERIGGHIVTGHVEGTGVIRRIRKGMDSTVMEIRLPPGLRKYVVRKGSVAVDGVSLTAADVSSGSFSVSLVPHTIKSTTLGLKKVGEEVNLETDILARYAERFAGGKEGISLDRLEKAGFLD